jgi:hypothetical protein
MDAAERCAKLCFRQAVRGGRRFGSRRAVGYRFSAMRRRFGFGGSSHAIASASAAW